MRRYQIVLGATAAGLAGVLSYHTVSAGNGVTVQATGSASSSTGSASTSAGAGSSSTTASTPTTAGSSSSAQAAPSTTTTAPSVRRAQGSEEQYRYGLLELQVTVSGGRITNVQPMVDEATDPRSAQINSEAVPMLSQQVLQAQSANIDGVSGASYTSAAFEASLQSALNKLGR